MDKLFYPQKDWIPPMELWLVLDFSHIRTIPQLEDIYNILKWLPDNHKEIEILKYYYSLFTISMTPIIDKDIKIPFIKKPQKKNSVID